MKIHITQDEQENRRVFLKRSMAVACLCAPGAIVAQPTGYPSRAVKIINPFPPGSVVDVVARNAAEALRREFGQPFTIESVTGAGGTIGVAAALRLPSDGYAFFAHVSTGLITGSLLYKQAGYAVSRDIQPVWAIRSPGLVLVVSPKSPHHSVEALISAAKAAPGKLTFSSAGAGSPQHLGAELLMREAGIKLTHVPYRGAVPAQLAVIAGDVDMTFDSISGALPQIRGDKMRPLGVTRSTRFAELPNTQTMAEAGLPGAELPQSAIGIFAHVNTDRAVVASIAKVLDQAFKSDVKLQEQYRPLGLGPALSGTALRDYMAVESAFYPKLLADAKIDPV